MWHKTNHSLATESDHYRQWWQSEYTLFLLYLQIPRIQISNVRRIFISRFCVSYILNVYLILFSFVQQNIDSVVLIVSSKLFRPQIFFLILLLTTTVLLQYKYLHFYFGWNVEMKFILSGILYINDNTHTNKWTLVSMIT